MLTNSTFKRKTYQRVPTVHKPVPAHLRRSASFARADGGHEAVEKETPLRSKPYRRTVTTLPCKLCGVEGHSQAAHPNTGKGVGLKTDDRRCFPLCADRPGVRGCHSQFDQGAMFDKATRQQLEADWGVDTRRTIENMGLWPEGLARWSE